MVIGGQVPAIQPRQVRQIGIRSVDPGEKRFVHEQGLEVFDMRFIDEEGMRHAMELARATIDALGHTGHVVPGLLSKVLTWSLAPLPRWARSRILGHVMRGMTEHRAVGGGRGA